MSAIVSFELCNEIKEICAPLRNYGITYFSYTRVYHNGVRLDLNTHSEMSEIYYVKSPMYQKSVMEASPIDHKSDFLLWNSFDPDESMTIMRDQFNITNGITLVNQLRDYTELCYFASQRENTAILNFYISNLDVLRLFVYYFKDKCQNLLYFLKNKINVLTSIETGAKINFKDICFDSIAPDINSPLVMPFDIKKFYIQDKENNTYLTAREMECIRWLSLGKSAHDISQILSLSPRTIEAHIDNVKKKMNCYKQTLLVHKLTKLGLIRT